MNEAARSAGVSTPWADVGISGGHLELLPRWGSIRSLGTTAALTYSEIDRAVDAAYPAELPPERQVVHMIPRLYRVDGLSGVRNPIGMHALRLDVETLCVTGASSAVQNLVTAVGGARIQVRNLVMGGVAAGASVLSKDEIEMGVILVDIGGGATTVTVFHQGTIWNAAVIPVGGHQFTTDLAVAMNTPYQIAEEVKLQHGQVGLEGVGDGQVEIEAFGDRRTVRVDRREMCRYLNDRTDELFRLIMLKIRGFGFQDMPPAGLVLTGGGANLPGIDKVARRVLATPVRIGVPEGVVNLPEETRDPMFASAIGSLLWRTRPTTTQGSLRGIDRMKGKHNVFHSQPGGPLHWLKDRVKRVAL